MSPSLYRKYRSSCFKDLIGQDHITQILSNSILYEKISHAYIFSGPRGTGKTSSARILSRSLNCLIGPTDIPCSKCDICKKILSGSSIDIIEIDAASNTGIDNIRSLSEQTNFLPMECRYKFYIIDEAHMLSTAASNALLKTIEEPPNNVIFILATTEPRKIPITIHSRCQHLQFKKIPENAITQHLMTVSKHESIKITEESAKIIAQYSDGCMRDALSLLEQVSASKNNQSIITVDDITFTLGGISKDNVYTILQALFNQDLKSLVTLLNKIVASGINTSQVIEDCMKAATALLEEKLAIIPKNNMNIPVDTISFSFLQELLETLSKTEMDLRFFSKPSLLFQIRLSSLIISKKNQNEVPLIESLTLNPQKKEQTTLKHTTNIKPSDDLNKVAQNNKYLAPSKTTINTPSSSPITTLSEANSVWNTLLENLKINYKNLSIILVDSKVSRFTNDTLFIKLSSNSSFFIGQLSKKDTQNIINTLLSEQYNIPLKFELEKTNFSTERKIISLNNQELSSFNQENKISPSNKRINEILDLFEGKIIH